jgi:hypothetical protein
MALVVMASLAVILSVTAMQCFAARQMLDLRHRQLQADWLARAGVELAAARLLGSSGTFTEDKLDLLPDAKVHIAVEQSGQDVFTITADAEVGAKEEAPVARTARGRFRRMDNDGVIRLQAIPFD